MNHLLGLLLIAGIVLAFLGLASGWSSERRDRWP